MRNAAIFRSQHSASCPSRAQFGARSIDLQIAPLHALVPTIVSLRRIEAGEFVMLDHGVRCSMDNGHHRA